MPRSGAEMFARYAYPPNALGYCGPADASVLLRRGPQADHEIAGHARQFEGAWAYLELIAGAAHIEDPLDLRVVEAYWLGNGLLDHIDDDALAPQLRSRLPDQSGAVWGPGRAHHGYHVFAVYPWLGLLARTKGRGPALNILNQCRIRWADVIAVEGDHVRVAGRALELRDGQLSLTGPVEQTVTTAVDGTSPPVSAGDVAGSLPVQAGDVVALHWDWICDILDPAQVGHLEAYTRDQLARSNSRILAGRA